jgi:hypothetical protein
MTVEEVAEYNEEALTCDGLDEAIIGVAERVNLGPVAAYSVEKILDILIPQMELSEEDLKEIPEDEQENYKYTMAMEYFEYNIKGAWMGEFTPVFIYTE